MLSLEIQAHHPPPQIEAAIELSDDLDLPVEVMLMDSVNLNKHKAIF